MARDRFVEVYIQEIANVEKIIVDTKTGTNDLLASSTLTAGCGMSVLVDARRQTPRPPPLADTV